MKVFPYKLDFYYQQAIMYLITLILYIVVRGTFTEQRFEFVYHDPIALIMVFFVLFAFTMIVINRVRNRRIVIEDDAIKFVNRFKERSLPLEKIEWMHVTKERKVETAGRLQAVIIKRKGRKRLIRIRVGRYERPDDFVKAIREIADRVPKRPKRSLTDKIKRQ
jgi:hypothetical protein